MKDEFEATLVVDLAPDAVWEALTERTVDVDAQGSVHYVLPGFPSLVSLGVVGASCTPLEVEPGRLLRVRKDHHPCAGTEIAVRLEQVETGTRITVVQSGFGPFLDIVGRDTVFGHGHQIMADFRLYLERRITVPGTRWGANLGAQTRQTPVGLEVVSVDPGGFADSAGIRPGDLLLTLRGIRLHDLQQLWTVLALTDAPSSADVTWARGNEPMVGKADFAS
jgi:uncharacterized protein YndB with AHSA1/START domain